jgi:hypothetical protein
VNYLVLFCDSPDSFLIISQDETNAIIPEIQKSQKAILYAFSPRELRAMDSCDELEPFMNSASPNEQLNKQLQAMLAIFSGQLYFLDEHHYTNMCDFLEC